jgi:hypothetical protein
MYVAMLILFIIPTAILSVAWVRPEKKNDRASPPQWRSECARFARIGATIALLASIGFETSWTYNGGSPHGMTAPRRLRNVFGLVAIGSVIASIALGALGKDCSLWRRRFQFSLLIYCFLCRKCSKTKTECD